MERSLMFGSNHDRLEKGKEIKVCANNSFTLAGDQRILSSR